jgi:hypothetical protein
MIALPLTGGCQCGAVRYEVTAPPLTVYACHCTECQRLSASAFGMSMPVPRGAVRITKGTPKRWSRTADSGNLVSGLFCGDCGCRLIHETCGNDAVVVVKPGTLDDTSWLRPVGHYWTQSAQPWLRGRLEGLVFERQARDFSVLIEAWRAREDGGS